MSMQWEEVKANQPQDLGTQDFAAQSREIIKKLEKFFE